MRVLIFLLLTISLKGQYFDTVPLKKKLDFVRHLTKSGQADDALYLLSKINRAPQEISDSLTSEEVKILIRLGRFITADSLLRSFKKQFENEGSNCTSMLLKNHINILRNNFDSLSSPACDDISHKVVHREAWRVQMLAAAVLSGSHEKFEIIFNSEKSSVPELSLIEFSLYVHNQEILRRKKKSGFLAGVFSAIIPGSGKLYAGKPHEMLGSFLPVVFNFAQSAEGYYYKKLESPHFYFFGTVGSVFYVSNIYGSVRAAKRKNEEFDFKIRNNVEFELAKLLSYY